MSKGVKQTNTVFFIFSKNNNLGNSKKMQISLRTLKAEKMRCIHKTRPFWAYFFKKNIFFKNCGIFLTVNLSVYKKIYFLKQTNTVVFIFSKK
jgi:hypothetical protein